MPTNKGESLIFTVMEAWISFPITYIFAMICDCFFVSSLAKELAFRFLVTPKDAPLTKAICISSCMVIIVGPIIRSLFQKAFPEGCIQG